MTEPGSTYEFLLQKGFSPEQPLQSRSNIVVSENGRRYQAMISPSSRRSTQFDVDGYLIKEGQKCDKLILVENSAASNDNTWIETFVELKGKDIPHAIDQLRTTLKNPLFKHKTNTIVNARIVATSFPSNKSDTTMEKAKVEFKKNFKCDLKGWSSSKVDKL